jgi:iron complex outermembrane receptor protein
MKRLLLAAFFFPIDAFPLDSRLVDSSGRPVAGAQVSVVDQPGTSRSDSQGRFTLAPDPRLPATLLVIGSRGEIYPPVYLTAATNEIRLDAVYRESVTVTPGVAPNIEGTPASAPVIIGSEEIEQTVPSHIVEAIAHTPGVSIRGEGPPAVPVLRGLAGGRTLLLIDDARIVAERRAGPSATFVDPLSLGSIEISRGPGSVAYGSDAMGGVVHLRPRDPVPGASDFRYGVWGAFGGTDTKALAAEVTTDLLGGAILAAVHARRADDGEDARGATIANSGYRDRGLMLRFVRDASFGRVRAGLMTSQARDIGAPTSDTVLTVYPDERATLATFAIDQQRSGFLTSAALRASIGSYAITTNRIRTTGVESASVKAHDGSFRLSGERARGRSRIAAGVDFVSRFDVRANPSIDDATRTDLGLYGTWSGTITPLLHLGGGLRADRVASENRGGFYGDITRNDTALSGFGAATVGPFSGVSITGQIATGYREPTISDRYFRGISGRGFVIGNPLLEPERSTQLDAGIRWSGARSRAALYAYHYQIRNLVERFRAGNDFQFRNRGEAEVRGVELELQQRLMPSLDLQIGSAIARGEDVASGAPLDDIAPPTLHVSLRWAAARGSAFATASRYGRDDRPGPVETTRAGYAELDLGGGWRIAPRLELRVVVRNVTNSRHFGSADAVAAFAPGRTVIVALNR